MELFSHFMNEHGNAFDFDNMDGDNVISEIVIKMTLYVSRASIFLYFFIWPLNYFIRFPKLRRELCSWNDAPDDDLSRRGTMTFQNGSRHSGRSVISGMRMHSSSGHYMHSATRLASTNSFQSRKPSFSSSHLESANESVGSVKI